MGLFSYSRLNALQSPIQTITSRTSTVTLIKQSSLTNPRKFALIATSIHSKLRSYLFYMPIAAAAWQRLGYQVIVILAGDFTSKLSDEFEQQMNLSFYQFQLLGVHVIRFQCDASYATKMSQLVRIFAGFLPDNLVQPNDYILTSDSDLIPIRSNDYRITTNTHGFIYNAFCCGSFQRRNRTYRMFPLSHICLIKQLWKEIFLQSEQWKEIQNLHTIIGNLTTFSFDLVNLYTRHEFGQLYDSDMKKGDAAWYMDQVYVSMLINDYITKHSNDTRIDRRYKESPRLDPDKPYHMWEAQRVVQYGDAHLIHDEIFDSYRWSYFRHLIGYLFDSTLANRFELYYKQFVLTLRSYPQ